MERLTEKQRHILQQKLCDMKRRCYNPEEKFYKDYGGRGIKVCDEWMDKKKDIAISKNGQLKMDGKKGAALIE